MCMHTVNKLQLLPIVLYFELKYEIFFWSVWSVWLRALMTVEWILSDHRQLSRVGQKCLEPALFPSVYLFVSWEGEAQRINVIGRWSLLLAKTPSVHSQPSTRWHPHSWGELGSQDLVPAQARFSPNIPPACLIQFILASRLGCRWRGINDPETQPTWSSDNPAVASFCPARGNPG